VKPTVAVVAAASLVTACSGNVSREGGPLIDERRGAYRGIEMGDSEAEVRRIFGNPESRAGFAPSDHLPAEVGVPQSLPVLGATVPHPLRYDDAAFLVAEEYGVYALIIDEEGARTLRGVGIGDDLDEAKQAYHLRCIDVAGGESPAGDVATYPSCSATIGRKMRIWFGRDPIRSITLLSLAHRG
jgi:hypothetical protein